jgi:hypothetical protein
MVLMNEAFEVTPKEETAMPNSEMPESFLTTYSLQHINPPPPQLPKIPEII